MSLYGEFYLVSASKHIARGRRPHGLTHRLTQTIICSIMGLGPEIVKKVFGSDANYTPKEQYLTLGPKF